MSDLAPSPTLDHRPLAVDPAVEAQANPLETILMVASGYCVPRALHVVAELGIADALGDKSATAEELAAATGTNADALGRTLSLLAAHGVFRLDRGRIAHNAASRLLRSDHPQSARALARMFGLPFCWDTFADLAHSVRTGHPASERKYPDGIWAWFAQHPEAGAIFDQAMTAKAHGQVAGVVATYDFSRFMTVADIGGGRGHLLRAIVDRWPGITGVLFEQPHVIQQLESMETDRLRLVAGDFFRDELPVCDAYLVMEVIHDWTDSGAMAILRSIARAAPKGATLLLVERPMPDTPEPEFTRMLDIHMMALFAARQRTRDEYHRLMKAAGFEPGRVIDTQAGVDILEAVRT